MNVRQKCEIDVDRLLMIKVTFEEEARNDDTQLPHVQSVARGTGRVISSKIRP